LYFSAYEKYPFSRRPAVDAGRPAGRAGLDSIRGMYVKYYFPGGHPKQELSYDTYQLTMVRRKDGWKILHDHSG
jgi:hypothetical protein